MSHKVDVRTDNGVNDLYPHAPNAGPVEVLRGDDIDLLVILKWLWSARWFALLGALAGLLFAVFALVSWRAVGPVTTTYNAAFVITLPEREQGKYPNGMVYSPTDLLSPSVLAQVHEINKLEANGISLADFGNMVSVTTNYSPLNGTVSERYRQRLADRNISFEEKRAIEQDYRNEINAVAASGILLTVRIPDSAGLTAQEARKILADIPRTWSDLFINRFGVVSFGAPVSGSKVIDRALLASLDYPLQYDYLYTAAARVRARIAELQALPGAGSLLDRETGKSYLDLANEIESLVEFQLEKSLQPLIEVGLSRTPEATILIYQNQIARLELERRRFSDKSRIVGEVVSQSDTLSVGALEPAGEASAQSPSIPQFDGSFVDRIIELSQKGGGQEFREDLLGRKLDLENESVDVEGRVRLLSARLEAIRKDSQIASQGETREVFEQGTDFVAASLDSVWQSANRIFADMSLRQLSQDKQLYRPAAMDPDLIIKRAGLLNLVSTVFLALALITGAILGVGTRLAYRKA